MKFTAITVNFCLIFTGAFLDFFHPLNYCLFSLLNRPLEEPPVKIKPILKSIAIASLVAFGATTAAYADMPAAQKSQVEGVVKDYILKNPEVLVQSLQSFQQKQYDEAQKTMVKTQQNASKFANDLFHDATDPVVGNPKGKVTVVEFFDYQCPHCIEMTPILEGLIQSNPEARIVFKEFPIRGPASEMASKAALAAKIQGKYFEFHKALMAANKVLTEEDIMKIAQNLGLDTKKLKDDMNSDTVQQEIKADYKLAQSLQLIGTPAFFIAKTEVNNSSPATAVVFIPGQIDKNQLETVVTKVSGS